MGKQTTKVRSIMEHTMLTQFTRIAKMEGTTTTAIESRVKAAKDRMMNNGSEVLEPEHTVSLMVDLETMGRDERAAIVSIGACLFEHNPVAVDSIHLLRATSFERNILLEDNANHDRDIDPATVRWWMGQEQAARDRVFTKDAVPLGVALRDFVRWLHVVSPVAPDEDGMFDMRVWANDPDFDLTKLKSAMGDVDVHYPFKFWLHRSCRTVMDLAWNGRPQKPQVDGLVAHAAADDAVFQAMYVQDAFIRLGV